VNDVGDPIDRRKELTGSGLVLTWWAEQTPDALAIVSGNGTRTFAQLDRRANQLVRALRRRGIRPGDSVALICDNRPEFAEVTVACIRGGLRLTPINWHLTEDEARYIATDCGAKAIIRAPLLGASGAAAGAVWGAEVDLTVGGECEGAESYDAALAAESDGPISDPGPGSVMLYTSGTTGRPKGVSRPPEAVNELAALNIYGYREDGRDVHLCTGPLYHAAPLAFSLRAPLAFGCGVVLMDNWDAEETLRLIATYRVTHTHMVPTMFHRLLSLPEDIRTKYDVSSLRYVLHGAAPCPVDVKRRLIEWLGPIVWEYYAATEGVGTFVDSKTWLERPGTVGRPAVQGQVKVADDTGDELPRGEIGLVWIRAPKSSRFEYYHDESKTLATYRGDYFCLGDMGYMDSDGYLFLTDRAADLIISGGVNVYPAEVEAVLLEHPLVADAAAIGVPNAEWGEEVKAVVALVPHVEATSTLAEQLISFTRERLAHYKCPRTVDFTDALPRQDNGKLYRRLLRDKYRQEPFDRPATEPGTA